MKICGVYRDKTDIVITTIITIINVITLFVIIICPTIIITTDSDI